MLDSELWGVVEKYTNQDITLEEFEDWLLPRSAFFLESSNPEDVHFAAGIELALAEATHEQKTEDELRKQLSGLLVAELPQTVLALHTSASGNVVTGTISSNPVPSYTPPEPAYI